MQDEGADDVHVEAASSPLFVDEETFCLWLDSTEFTVGLQVQKWWARLVACEDDGVDALKMGDDETTVDLYRRIVSSLEKQGERNTDADGAEQEGKDLGDTKQGRGVHGRVGSAGVAKTSEPRGVKESVLTVSALVEWLQAQMGDGLGLNTDPDLVLDDVMHELEIATRFKGIDDDKGAVREPDNESDGDDDALRTAERMVYGWPSRECDPTAAHSFGRFVKSFP